MTSKCISGMGGVGQPVELGKHQGPLRIVAFSDYRVQKLDHLCNFIQSLRPRPDLILYAGDDVQRFHPTPQLNFFEELAGIATYGVCAVIGNDSPSEHTGPLIRGNKVWDVHCRPVILGPYAVIGLEGAPYNPKLIYPLAYREGSAAKHLRTAAKKVPGKILIVVSHAPPRKILDRAQRYGNRNIGSLALQKFVRGKRDVALVVSGHVHRCGGQCAHLGKAVVVNAASHDDYGEPGRVAIIELEGARVSTIQWELLYEVGAILGIGRSRTEMLKAAGIHSLADLSRAPVEFVAHTVKTSREQAELLTLRAKAILDRKAHSVGSLCVPGGQRAFLDIETDLGGKRIFLIGVYLENENKFHSFFAPTWAKEKEVLENFLTLVQSPRDLSLLSYSGSKFEERVLRARLSAYGLPVMITGTILDLFWPVSSSVALPVTNYKLKTLAAFFGYRYKHPEIGGFQVPSVYERFLQTRSPSLKKKLIQHNRDDVNALRLVLKGIQAISESEGTKC